MLGKCKNLTRCHELADEGQGHGGLEDCRDDGVDGVVLDDGIAASVTTKQSST
jgi:hypothetical protein